MTQDEVNMAVKSNKAEGLCKVVGQVLRDVDIIKDEEVAFDPVNNCKIADIHMSGSGGGFLCIGHSDGPLIILIEKRCCVLRDTEVMHNAANEKADLSCITCGHKLSLCG